MATKTTNKSLGQYALKCAGHEVGFNSHINQACECSRSVVCVDGAEDEVAGHGRLNGADGSFGITYFTDQHDIGVMAQDTSKAGGEGESNLRLHLNLADLLQIVLDRILDRDDLEIGAADIAE